MPASVTGIGRASDRRDRARPHASGETPKEETDLERLAPGSRRVGALFLLVAVVLVAVLVWVMAPTSPAHAQTSDELVELSPEAVMVEPLVEELGIVDETPALLQLPPDVPTLINQAAHRYGLDAAQLHRIARCESGYQPHVISPWGHIGVFQWDIRTFAWASVQAGYGGYSPFNAEANVFSAAWLMSTPGGAAHWTCR